MRARPVTGLIASAVVVASAIGAPSPAAADTVAPIVVIVMENHSYGAADVGGRTTKFIVGNPDAPYINGSLIPQSTLLTNYDASGRDSLPNYLLMTAGTDGGCTTDLCPTDSLGLDNIFHQLGEADVPFNSFAESMPENCRTENSGPYIAHHNPEVYFTDVDAASGLAYGCAATDVPTPASWPSPLPSFSFVIPNRCDSMHGTTSTGTCPAGTDQLITTGDTWLAQNVPAFLAQGAIVIVTFDEGAGGDTTGGGGHVLTAMIGPGIGSGALDDSPYTHASLLAGLEDYLGVGRLAGAADALPIPLPSVSRPPAPTIDGFTPDSGAAGDQVTISGTNLTGVSAVRFGGMASMFSLIDDATIEATVPAGAVTGDISVSGPGGIGVGPAPFTVTTPPPAIIQQGLSSGSSSAPTGHWPAPTTDGNLLVAAIGWSGSGRVSAPSGWTLAVMGSAVAIFYVSAAPTTSAPVLFPLSASGSWIVDLTEWSGIANGPPDVIASNTGKAKLSTTANSGTTASTARSSEIAIAALTALSAVTQSGPTNGFTERDAASQGSKLTVGFYDSVLVNICTVSVSATLSAPAKWRGAIATFRGL